MKKANFNMAGTKQIINSDYKLFNKQTNCISYGNIIANTQYSSYIRPYGQTTCNNHNFLEGELMKSDLKHFGNIPASIKDKLYAKDRKESYILYEFFVYRNGIKDIIGYVLTDKKHKLITYEVLESYNNYNKRLSAILETLPYITNDL